MDVCRLLGREESGLASQLDANLLRLLTPVVKLYTGKQVCGLCKCESRFVLRCFDCFCVFMLRLSQAVAVVSEGLESFGGQGYIEDTGLPGLLRDSQVRLLPETCQRAMLLKLKFLTFPGIEYLGGNYECSVPGCAALCGS